MAIENISEIEKVFGIEEGKFSEMMTSDDNHKIDLSSMLIEPKSIYDERVKNIKADASQMAKEIAIKKIRTTLGLEFEGKTEENLIEALNTRFETIKGEVVKDPEQRYTALKTDFDKLQVNLQSEITKRTELETNYATKEKKETIKNDIFKYIPNETIVSKGTIILEANEKGFTFDSVDGMTVVKNNSGEIVKDEQTLSPISLEVWMKSFATPYLKPIEGGSGRKDDVPPAKAGSYEAFMKESEKQGWNDQQRADEMSKRLSNKTLIM